MIFTEITKEDSLVSLIQSENYVGRIYSINYEDALVLTNDKWKKEVNGIPQNSFLIATSIEPENYAKSDDFDKEIILLRVNGACKLPQDDDNIRTKLDQIENRLLALQAQIQAKDLMFCPRIFCNLVACNVES